MPIWRNISEDHRQCTCQQLPGSWSNFGASMVKVGTADAAVPSARAGGAQRARPTAPAPAPAAKAREASRDGMEEVQRICHPQASIGELDL